MKRLISALLAMLVLASLAVAPVSAADIAMTPTESTDTCSCGCGLALEAVQWKPWDPNTNGHPISGHYYLNADYTQSKQYQVNSAVRAVIDLRGHKLTTEGSRLFLVYGYLAMIDTVGGGRACAKSTGNANGGAVMVALNQVEMNEVLDGTFALYNCTLTLDTGNNGGLRAGLVDVGNGASFQAYNSKLMNASSKNTGGAIHGCAGSNVELTDSSVIGCSATKSGGAVYSQGSVTLENCVLTGCKAGEYGGNIYMNGGSLTVTGSKIESGISAAAVKGGGNIAAIGGCKVEIKDSTIRNGYAASCGGNLYFEKGTQTITGTNINSGVSKGQGGNLYCATSTAVTNLDGCTVSGDVYYESGKLTLKGAAKIGLNNYGLKLSSAVVLDTSGLTFGAEVYVDGQTVSGEYLKAGSYCPHCDQAVIWDALSGTPSGHCYLTEDIIVTTAYEITADTVVDLRGCGITSSDRAFTVAAGGSLTLLDSVGGATVKGSGNADGLGGVISNAGMLTVYGGNYTYAADAAKPLNGGGVICTGSAVAIHGGTFDGSGFDRTAQNCYGGALYQTNDAGVFTMSAGHFIGGKAYRGGSVYIGGNNTVTITGGSITGGIATNHHGNLAIAGAKGKDAGTANVTGLSVTGGTAGNCGGNMTICYYADSYVTDCYISGGTASVGGGNVYFTSASYVTLTDCVVLGGSAAQGGNIYDVSYVSEATLVDCLVADGAATAGNGGNLCSNNGLITIQGGAYAYGTATSAGGNIYNAAGSYDNDEMRIQALDGELPVITGGSAGTYGGNIYNNKLLTIDAAFINNGRAATAGNDLYHSGTGNTTLLTVGEGLVGNISMSVAEGNLGTGIYGQPIAKTAATTLNAKLALEGIDGSPYACVSEGGLCVGAATVKKVDGSEVWYPDNAAAIAACPADGWVKLYTDQPVVMTKDCNVDLNGKTVSVSGDHTLYGMDSSGDDYSVSSGSAVWTSAETVKASDVTDAPNGNRYVAIADGAAVSYHRLEMKLNNVNIQTTSCGIYYTGTWNCDSVLAEKIGTYGIALSLHYMPGVDFARDSGCRYTSYAGTALVGGETKTGVAVTNIMKSNLLAAANAKRGEMPIYATAYVRFKDGTVYVSDREGSEDDIAYSLRTAMERMDELIVTRPMLFLSDSVHTAREFYAQWEKDGMQNWKFNKLKQPEDDGILKIIILGSSRSVNTFQLLYEAFKDQMPNQKLVLGVMYESGCSMTMHENFIKTNQAVYDYYRNDSGRWVITSGVDMATGLHADNWDVILLQAGTGDTDKQMQLATRTFLKEYIDDHVIDPHQLWWHSTWFNSTDPDLYKPPKTAEDAAKVDQIAQLTQKNEAAKQYVLNDPMFAGHITSGTPMMYALKVLGVAEKDLFRDHTHLSDFGCLLVGYAWYAQFTGKPVTEIGIDTIPVYLRHRDYQSLGDMTVTERMKQIIVDTVSYTLENPWAVPEK